MLRRVFVLLSLLSLLTGCYEAGYVAGKTGFYAGMGTGMAIHAAPEIATVTMR